MSKTNLPAVQAGEPLNEDTASTDPDAGVPIGDEDQEVDELRPFALEELVVGHQSREGSGDAAMWRSNNSRLRIEFGRLQVVDNDLETWRRERDEKLVRLVTSILLARYCTNC